MLITVSDLKANKLTTDQYTNINIYIPVNNG